MTAWKTQWQTIAQAETAQCLVVVSRLSCIRSTRTLA